VSTRTAIRGTALLALFALSAPVAAQDSPFAVEQITPPPAVLPVPTPTDPGKSPILAGWDNGFFLRSPDQQFQLRITGQIQIDDREYMDARDAVDTPGFLIRRARLGIEANVLKYYEFRFMPDFGNGMTRLQDSYLNIHYLDDVQFEVGKFKQPFSQEQLIQDRFVPLIERSLIDQLVPARDVGVMLHGQKLLDDRFDYGFSVYGGVPNGDQDDDHNREGAGRIVVRPLRNLGADMLDGIQLGIAGTIGQDDGTTNPNILRTPAGVPWFVFAPKAHPDGRRERLSPEFAYIYGPATLSAQYYWQSSIFFAPASGKVPATDTTLAARGGYVMGTLLVTGEERTSLSQAIDPLRPFDPVDEVFGTGALELVGRVSRLELSTDDPAMLVRLSDPARSASRATELTLGFNWYLNRFVRFQFNWEYAQFANPVRLGPTASIDHQNSFLTRFQIVF
jgi:phosphate-selective porin OprO/OprP